MSENKMSYDILPSLLETLDLIKDEVNRIKVDIINHRSECIVKGFIPTHMRSEEYSKYGRDIDKRIDVIEKNIDRWISKISEPQGKDYIGDNLEKMKKNMLKTRLNELAEMIDSN
jgi:hypothetical protein